MKTNDHAGKYKLESGNVIYEMSMEEEGGEMETTEISLHFEEHGAVEVWSGTLMGGKVLSIVKQGDRQTYHYRDGSTKEMARKPDFPMEYMVQNTSSPLFAGLLLAKPATKKFLKRKCDFFYHFELKEGPDWRGSIAFWEGIPLFIDGRGSNSSFKITATYLGA